MLYFPECKERSRCATFDDSFILIHVTLSNFFIISWPQCLVYVSAAIRIFRFSIFRSLLSYQLQQRPVLRLETSGANNKKFIFHPHIPSLDFFQHFRCVAASCLLAQSVRLISRFNNVGRYCKRSPYGGELPRLHSFR